VRKLADEQLQYDNGKIKLKTSAVYDSIKRSNSSLARRSKKQLEDSIERVLSVIKEEQAEEEDSITSDFDGIEEIDDLGLQVCGRDE
jgi:ribosome biogenesis ATPase